MDWKSFGDAIFESGVDRIAVGGACHYLLPPAQRFVASAWRRSRPRLAADYGSARSASLWRKAFATVAIPAVVIGFAAYAVTSSVYGAPPLWAQAWLGGVVAAGVFGCAAREGWLTGCWVVRRTRRLLV